LLAREGGVADSDAIALEMISNIVREVYDRPTIVCPGEREGASETETEGGREGRERERQ
jgi:hypothetical protein